MDQLNQKQFRTPTAIMGIFDLLRLASLRTRLEDWSCKMKQNKWDTLFNWYLEASKHIWDSKIASLQNTISKLIEENKQLENIKKLLRSLFPLPYPLCLQVHRKHLVPRSLPWCHFPFFLCAVLPSHSIPFTELPIFTYRFRFFSRSFF